MFSAGRSQGNQGLHVLLPPLKRDLPWHLLPTVQQTCFTFHFILILYYTTFYYSILYFATLCYTLLFYTTIFCSLPSDTKDVIIEGRDHSKATCPHLEHAQGWKKWVELRLSKTVQRGYSPPDVARISYSEYGFGYITVRSPHTPYSVY